MAIGANELIVKPVAMNVLFDTVGKMIATGSAKVNLPKQLLHPLCRRRFGFRST